jgi:dihydrodipicolinate synthase/N-acetylneuraminate lyase
MLTLDLYRGVIAYPPTPFTENFALDEEALRSNLRKLIACGVDGIALAGTSGEFYTLSLQEIRRIASILREETKGTKVYSVLGAVGLSTDDAIARGRIAMEEGIDAILVIQPYYTPLTPDELLRFWEQLCRACPTVGVIIYHYDWVRQPYTVDIYRQLSHLPNLVGSKEAHWDFNVWRTMHREGPLAHMSSTDIGWLVELHRLRAVGVGSLQLCWMPHKVLEILDLCALGKYDEAERAQSDFTEFTARMKMGQGRPHIFPSELEGLDRYSHQARHKAVIDAFGFLRVGPPRSPAIAVPVELRKRIRGFIERRYPELLLPPGFSATSRPTGSLWRLPS